MQQCRMLHARVPSSAACLQGRHQRHMHAWRSATARAPCEPPVGRQPNTQACHLAAPTYDHLVHVAAAQHAQRALMQAHDGQVRPPPLRHFLICVDAHQQEIARLLRLLQRLEETPPNKQRVQGSAGRGQQRGRPPAHSSPPALPSGCAGGPS